MTEPVDSGAPRSTGPRRASASARLRLVRRAIKALTPLEAGVELQADVENWPAADAARADRGLRTDLLLAASDLRVRLALLPGADAAQLDRSSTAEAAIGMLLDSPDTGAVVAVADDDELTARLFEPSDGSNTILAQTSSDTVVSDEERRGPLGKLIRGYLRQVNPGWEDVSRIAPAAYDLRTDALELAMASIIDLQAGKKRTPEAHSARSSLSRTDAQWVADLAARVRTKEVSDVVSDLQARTPRIRQS